MNGLWFLSLVISITCALLATLLQQWARRYLKATQPHYSLHKRARMRSFFAEGVEKSFLPLAVEALPTLLHISLFLFFAGLVVFLRNVDLTIFKLVLSWIGVCTALYGFITLIPIFRHDSPYYTPLTPLARPIVIATLKVFFYLRLCFYLSLCGCVGFGYILWSSFFHASHRVGEVAPENHRHDWLREVVETTLMTSEEATLKVSSSIYIRAFMWTLDSLDEDHELERFFSSLPDFRRSKVIADPLPSLTKEEKEKIFRALTRFLDFTFSSDFLSEAVKHQRAIMCAKALDLAQFSPESAYRLRATILPHRTHQTTNFGPITDDSPTEHTVFVQGIATEIVTRVRQRDDSWFRQAAPNALGLPETVLREYAANGDSLSLAVLIHVTRQQFTYYRYWTWPKSELRHILRNDYKFNARNTSPELQHEFCTLWNYIVLRAREDDDSKILYFVLKPIFHIYITLHHDTDSAPTQFSASTNLNNHILGPPSSYPVCKVPGHVHGNSTSTSFVRADPHHLTADPSSRASPDPPSSSVPVPLPLIEIPTDVSSLDNFHPTQASIQVLCSPPTSADLATASVRDIDSSGTTTPLPTPQTSTSAPFLSGPPSTAVLHYNADQLTPSSPLNLPSLASLNPVLNNRLPTGLSLP